MAYSYRYQLKDRKMREQFDLTAYDEEIRDVLRNLFGENLKDAFVEEKQFEFRLYMSVSKAALQRMGRELKWVLPVYGFSRMEQKLYALVYLPQDEAECHEQEGVVHIELIDSMILDRPELFLQRSKAFAFKTMELEGRAIIDAEGADDIIKNYYIDVLDAYVAYQSLPAVLKSKNAVSCFEVTGHHRRYSGEKRAVFDREQGGEQKIFLEKCYDAGYVEHREAINGLVPDWENCSDIFNIRLSKERIDLVQKIEKALALILMSVNSIPALNTMKPGKKYTFRVHNVGQALATSIACEGCDPFLYFDYGMPFGKNAKTRPSSVDTPMGQEPAIILSHVDKDHWFRIADKIDAYKCHWFLPEQSKRINLRHKLAEIIMYGGTVNLIKNDIYFPYGNLTCGGISRINPSRRAATVHETGLTLRIQGTVDGQDCNILVAGDQEYDYIEQPQLDDLDILVASHHGGGFSWSKKDAPPTARKGGLSTVIYSYGAGNTYNHPTKCQEYRKSKWANEYHVCNSGDYLISILL